MPGNPQRYEINLVLYRLKDGDKCLESSIFIYLVYTNFIIELLGKYYVSC